MEINLNFPRYCGWLQVYQNTIFPTYKPYWFVLIKSELIYYRSWRSQFAEDYISLTTLKLKVKGNTDMIFDYESNKDQEVKRVSLYVRAESKNQRDELAKTLLGQYDVKQSIHEWKTDMETKTNPKFFPELQRQLLGVLSVSKDAKTSWEDVTKLSEYLATCGVAKSMVDLFIYIMQTMGIKYFTNDLVIQPSVDDSVDIGFSLLYLLRRLLWRFGYASPRFGFELTKTPYLLILKNDLVNLLKTPNEEWLNGNYLLFSSLDLIQQCARTEVPKSYFYQNGIKEVLTSLIYNASKEVKLASMISLAQIVEKDDVENLKIDKEILLFMIKILNETIGNKSHMAAINKRVPYYTNLTALFYFIGILCKIHENRALILNTGIFEQLTRVSTMNTHKELLATLHLVDVLAFNVETRKDLVNNPVLLEKIEILKDSRIVELSEKAQSVYKNLYKIDIPASISNMNSESIQRYLNALQHGSVLPRNARIILLGHSGAGKTSLCKRFLGRAIDGVETTVGIDIFIHRFVWDLESKKWFLQKLGNELDSPSYKLANVLRSANAQQRFYNVSTVQENDRETDDATDGIPATRPKISDAAHASDVFDCSREMATDIDKGKDNGLYSRTDQMKKIKDIFHCEQGMDFPTNYAFVSVWDFAGQDVYYFTHHIFLSPDAVYLIVLDLSDKDSLAPIEKARYWLKSILTYSKIAKDQQGFWCPPIAIVGTHKDKLPGETNEEKERYAAAQFKELLDLSELSGLDTSFIKHFFIVDNTINDPEIKVLQEKLLDLAKGQLHWEREIPTKWFILERELMLRKEKGTKVLTIEEIRQISLSTEAPIEDNRDVELFLKFMHEEGIVLFFHDSEDLRKYIVTDPQWIVKAFVRLISEPTCQEQIQNKHLRKLFKQLDKKGNLQEEFVDAAWKKDEENNFIEHKVVIINIMEALNLISKPVNINVSTAPGYWIVPSMLKNIHLSNFLEICQYTHVQAFKSCTLCLRIKKNIVPDYLYDRLLATCLSRWSPCEKNNRSLVFRFCACFKVDNWNVILFCDRNTVQSAFFRLSSSTSSNLETIGQEILQVLENVLLFLLHLDHAHEGLELTFLCRPMLAIEAKPLKMLDIFRLEKVQCCDHITENIHHLTLADIRQWIQIGSTLPKPDIKSIHQENKIHLPMLRYIQRAKEAENLSQGFKKGRDTTITERHLDIIRSCCSSVGSLTVPGSTATVFRVGPCYVMTAFHVIQHIVYNRTFTQNGGVHFELCVSNLCNENVYIKFSHMKDVRFYLEPVLPSYNDVLDFVILKLDLSSPDKILHLPPPFTEFMDEYDLKELTAMIGYGHPDSGEKIIETRVKLVSKTSERIDEAQRTILLNSGHIKGIMSYLNKDTSKVDNAYSPILNPWVVLIDCFMEKGSSGAPGFVIRGHEARVVMMVTGGLPVFLWDLPEEQRAQVAPKLRIEYGTSMRAIFDAIEDNNLRESIFGNKN